MIHIILYRVHQGFSLRMSVRGVGTFSCESSLYPFLFLLDESSHGL